MDAVRQALQLPPSVSAVLALKSPTFSTLDKPSQSLSVIPSTPPIAEHKVPAPSHTDTGPSPSKDASHSPSPTSLHGSQLYASKPIHRREGAFLPSVSTVSESASPPDTSTDPSSPLLPTPAETSPAEAEVQIHVITEELRSESPTPSIQDIPPVRLISPPPRDQSLRGGLDVDRDDHWVNISRELTPSPERRKSVDMSTRSASRSRSPPIREHVRSTPSPPPKSFRNSLTNLKRFSTLPRTPSTKSSTGRSSTGRPNSGSNHYSSRTPSPTIHPPVPAPHPRQKIKEQYPSAMFCHEIFTHKSAVERCALYANKINELYMYDCGLGDWVLENRLRGL